MRFVFIQSFSLADVCGGARILRSVANGAPVDSVESICTGFGRSEAPWKPRERLIPMRPGIGRLEYTRLHWLGGYVEKMFRRSFQARLAAALTESKATDVHIVPHTWGDFDVAFQTARRLGLRVHCSIHDDFHYTASKHPFLRRLDHSLGTLWREARTRFVISKEMGGEYIARHGERPWLIHTDGAAILEGVGCQEVATDGDIQVYFMGLFLNGYLQNFEALLDALSMVSRRAKKRCRVLMRSRCPPLRREWPGVAVEARGYVAQEVLSMEMAASHLLYLPLPFDPEAAAFNRLSLSTKMVSYLASGTPIFYHGPDDSAAAGYLRRNGAAFLEHSLDSARLSEGLEQALLMRDRRREASVKAMAAARADFSPELLFERFWNAVST